MSLKVREYEEFVEKMARIPISNLDYSTLGLCGESGEVAEWVKKATHRGDEAQTEEKLFKELGDVQHYITRIALRFKWTLKDIMQGNMDKLTERHGVK